jgi:hypothetical protein
MDSSLNKIKIILGKEAHLIPTGPNELLYLCGYDGNGFGTKIGHLRVDHVPWVDVLLDVISIPDKKNE